MVMRGSAWILVASLFGISLSAVQEKYWNANLDNFEITGDNTFKQRYFVDDQYWIAGNRSGPVFICVGGEGPPLDSSVLGNSVHCTDMVELGKKQHALLLALEHRFYGESVPTQDLSVKNLATLSAHQALADLAGFSVFIRNEFKLDDEKNKWVSWGGSYPGMLSAWFRLKFPNLVHAAVSSSAPVKAAVDFLGYFNVVADAVAAEIIGGSQRCASIVREGHAQVGKLLESVEGRNQLTKMFNICGSNQDILSDPDNQADWAGNGVVGISAQDNYPACTEPLCNIQKICQFLNATGEDSLNSLASLSKSQFEGNCVQVDHQATINQLKNENVSNPSAWDRVWYWQTCTEFAFYQTCEVGSKCLWTQGLNTVDQQLRVCKDVFGISAAEVKSRVDFSNFYWGADKPSGSRVLFVNGQIDPWHALSLLESPDPENLPTLWVPGASHHFWTHPILPTDTSYIVDARNSIWSQVTRWLANAETK
jgi:pimeloyl-ACP methyl ester carboxylesterase